LQLSPFGEADVRDLAARQGMALTAADAELLWSLVGGQPYLTRLALHRLTTTPGLTPARLDETAAEPEGPFGEHLRSLLIRIQRRPELRLLEAMQQADRLGSVNGEETFQRLAGAGLVRRESGRVVPANLLYARFFRAVR